MPDIRTTTALPSPTDPLVLCQIAKLNLYTLAIHAKNTDISEQALFYLSEMEHYTTQTPPTRTRIEQITRFITACERFRRRVEAASLRIPELSITA